MNEPKMVNRMDSVRDMTIDDLVNWCHQRGLDPAAVTLTGGHVKWTSLQTPEEVVRAAEWQAQVDARHEKWERETYVRLHAKFAGTVPEYRQVQP